MCIEQTNYYDIQFTIDSGITGHFKKYFAIIGLNLTFYTSSSYSSCNLNRTNTHCSFSKHLPGKNDYLIAFSVQDHITLSIMYHGRYDWFAVSVLPNTIFLGCLALSAIAK